MQIAIFDHFLTTMFMISFQSHLEFKTLYFLEIMEFLSNLPLLFIANDQSWKHSQNLTPWWSVCTVFIFCNSKKYIVNLFTWESFFFFSFYNLVINIAKQFNIHEFQRNFAWKRKLKWLFKIFRHTHQFTVQI